MGIQSHKLTAIALAATLQLVGAASANAAVCTSSTARQASSNPEVLCDCDAVTSGMIRYIQRRADFGNFLARTGAECPQLAALLSDIPTASIGVPDQRSGDGDANDNPDPDRPNGNPGDPDPQDDPDPTDDPDPKDKDKKDKDKDKDKKDKDKKDKGKKDKGKKDKGKKDKGKKDKGKKDKDKKDKGKKDKGKKDKGDKGCGCGSKGKKGSVGKKSK